MGVFCCGINDEIPVPVKKGYDDIGIQRWQGIVLVCYECGIVSIRSKCIKSTNQFCYLIEGNNNFTKRSLKKTQLNWFEKPIKKPI